MQKISRLDARCSSTSDLSYFFLQAINWKLLGGMNPTAEHYLVLHRFGDFTHANDADAVKVVVDEFHKSLNSKMNAKNIRGYIDSFAHRTDLAQKMSGLTVPILIITGELPSFLMALVFQYFNFDPGGVLFG